MRYSLFEQAATEAGICAKEIDGEIEALKARKQVLDGLMQHLAAALPMLGKTAGAAKSAASSEAADPSASTGGEHSAESPSHSDSWTSLTAATGTPGTTTGATPMATGVAALSFANPQGFRERVLR